MPRAAQVQVKVAVRPEEAAADVESAVRRHRPVAVARLAGRDAAHLRYGDRAWSD